MADMESNLLFQVRVSCSTQLVSVFGCWLQASMVRCGMSVRSYGPAIMWKYFIGSLHNGVSECNVRKALADLYSHTGKQTDERRL